MKLSSIIAEGFRYEEGMSLDEFRQAEEEYKDSKRPKDNPTRLFRERGVFTFETTDSQEDLIHIEPLMKSTPFPVMPKNSKSLSTFRNSSIIYGFAVRSPNDYFGAHTQPDLGHLPPIMKDPEHYEESRAIIQELVAKIKGAGQPPGSGQPPARIPNTINDLKQYTSNWNLALKQIERGTLHGYDEYVDEIHDTIDTTRELIDIIAASPYDSISGMEQEESDAKKKEANIVKVTTKEHEKREKKLRNAYIGKLQFAFAKAVKNPNPKNEFEIAIHEAFVEEATLLVLDKLGEYNIIVYPQSGSTFNKIFAELLASNMTSAEAIEIPKVIDPKNVKIDLHELELRAHGTRHSDFVMQVNDEDMHVKANDPLWEKKWAQKEANKLKAQIGKSIKSLKSGDKRRYAQLFELTTGVDPTKFAGMEILIIDDNVHHQGTMEMLNVLVNSMEPSSIDIFTPFLLKDFNRSPQL